MNSKLVKWKPNARQLAIIVGSVYLAVIVVLMYCVVLYAGEDISVTLLGIVGTGLFGIILAWFVNSYLARDLEKRKKKYELKLEVYAELHKFMEALVLLGMTGILFEILQKRIEGTENPAEPTSRIETTWLLWAFDTNVAQLKASLRESGRMDLFEGYRSQYFMGISYDEIESLEKEEFKEKVREIIHEKMIDMVECNSAVIVGINKCMSRIFAMGDIEVAASLQFLLKVIQTSPSSEYTHEEGNHELRKLNDELRKKILPWKLSVDNVEAHLRKDLDETL